LYGAVAALAARARIVRGPLVYAYALLRVLAFYEPPGFRVQFDGGIYHDRAWMVAFANTPVFGGGMRIAPGARVDDGLLDLVVVREVRRRELLRVFPRVYRGGHVGHPAVVAARTAAATIEVERPETCYGDGEPIVLVGPQPLRIAVRTAALRVVAGEPPP
jgi:diacylglycerol kinase (ATP)